MAEVWSPAAPGTGGLPSRQLTLVAGVGRDGGGAGSSPPTGKWHPERKKGPSGASPFTHRGLSFREQIKHCGRNGAGRNPGVGKHPADSGQGLLLDSRQGLLQGRLCASCRALRTTWGRGTSTVVAALTVMVPARCSEDAGAGREAWGPGPQPPRDGASPNLSRPSPLPGRSKASRQAGFRPLTTWSPLSLGRSRGHSQPLPGGRPLGCPGQQHL